MGEQTAAARLLVTTRATLLRLLSASCPRRKLSRTYYCALVYPRAVALFFQCCLSRSFIFLDHLFRWSSAQKEKNNVQPNALCLKAIALFVPASADAIVLQIWPVRTRPYRCGRPSGPAERFGILRVCKSSVNLSLRPDPVGIFLLWCLIHSCSRRMNAVSMLNEEHFVAGDESKDRLLCLLIGRRL